jgi:hypothetical protein
MDARAFVPSDSISATYQYSCLSQNHVALVLSLQIPSAPETAGNYIESKNTLVPSKYLYRLTGKCDVLLRAVKWWDLRVGECSEY